MIGSSFFRGGLRITSWSTGSTPSNWLGRPVGGISVEFHVSANNRLKVGLVRERSLSIKMLMQKIHRVERVAQPEHRAQRDDRQRRCRGAELEGQEVFLDVVEYQFSCNAVSE